MQIDDEAVRPEDEATLTRALDQRVERARLLLLEAMFDPGQWETALDAVTNACGAYAGQLLALNERNEVVGHWLSGAPNIVMGELEAYGFADPVTNPRFRLGIAAPLMTAVADQDYVDADERRRSPIYADIYERHDLPFNCQAVLVRDESAFIRTSITRTAKQGPLDAESFAAFRSLMPHLQAAVRVQTHMLASRCAATLHSLDAVGAAALLLNETGRVLGASAAAEALLAEGDVLQILANRLRLPTHADQIAYEAVLARLMEAARNGDCIAPEPISLSGGTLELDVQPLPRDRVSFGGAPAALALVRPVRFQERARTLRKKYGLTRAEADVAMALADGDALEGIAARRAVAIATVRSQVQSVYTKMDVHRQAELAAAVRRLGGS